MGLKDPLGHDLGHLYVGSTGTQIDAIVPWSVAEKPTMDKVNSRKEDVAKEASEETSGSSSCDSEESTNSDNDSERLNNSASESHLLPKTHRQLCRSPCLEPHILKRNEILQDFRIEEAQMVPKEVKKPPDVVKEYQTKLEFALKLGYSEEQVQLVLNKLGTDALINDILGELVKLGNKTETDQTVTNANTSVIREASSVESQRSESPLQEDVTEDGDNLRPIVIDGSNVAMRYVTMKLLLLYLNGNRMTLSHSSAAAQYNCLNLYASSPASNFTGHSVCQSCNQASGLANHYRLMLVSLCGQLSHLSFPLPVWCLVLGRHHCYGQLPQPLTCRTLKQM